MKNVRARAGLPFLFAALPLVAWGAAQGTSRAPQRPFPELSARGSTRILFWGGDRSGGQAQIHFGQPQWNDGYDARLESLSGKRWRLGQNLWTTLDTNLDLEFGEVLVPAGSWYLALERDQAGDYVLFVLDPVEIRDAHLDAFQVDQTKGGIAIAMEHRDVDVKADKLQIRLDLDGTRKDGAKLVIHFGKHELSALLTMTPVRD
jgi:hypothetical protein